MKEYKAWNNARGRCYHSNIYIYRYYGGRGITMCNRWINSFKKFIEDMGTCPKGYTLERINNDGNYEPNNCKWASQKEQQNNKRPKQNNIIARKEAFKNWHEIMNMIKTKEII